MRRWNPFGSRRSEQEMQEEFEDHLRARIEDLVSSGVDRAAAEMQARREFGSVVLAKEECREAWPLAWLDGARRTFKFAARQLRKDLGFTLTAVTILALCIGANTAMFSVVDAALLRPLPYPHPERLAQVRLHVRTPEGEFPNDAHDGRTWEFLKANAKSVNFAAMAGTMGVNLGVSDSSAVYVQQHRVSAGYFRVLGVAPMMGREFTDEEDRAGGPSVAVVSESLWRTRFAADPAMVGRAIRLRGEPFTVIGVMPAGFESFPKADVWTPLRPSRTGEGGGANYTLLARVQDGVSWGQSQDELRSVTQSFYADRKLRAGVSAEFQLVPVQEARAQSVRNPVLLLWAAVGLVLLIGCVNLGGLLLARGGARAHEIATRLALGSSRAAVTRQLLTESLLLALIGGTVGMALAWSFIHGFGEEIPKILGVGQTPQLDVRVVALALLTTIATVVAFVAYPAWSLTRLDLNRALADAGRYHSARRSWARQGLVAGEVALTVFLLAGAGLVFQTLRYLTSLDPGFDGTDVMTAGLSLQDARYASAAAIDKLFDSSLERMRANPEIENAGVMLTLPYERALNSPMTIADGPRATTALFSANVVYVTPGALEALRVPLRSGRLFDARDRRGGQNVAIVNEAFIKRYLRDDQPIGRHVMDAEIVGVIGDTQLVNWDGKGGPVARVPTLYIPAAQTAEKTFAMVHQWFSPKWVVRTRGPQAGVASFMRQALAEVDPLLPFAQFQSMDEVRASRFQLQRAESILFGSLAAMAMLLAVVGIFGLIAQSVLEQQREIGIRLALGSPLWRIVRGKVANGLVLVAVGAFVGGGMAVLSDKYIQSLLWGVKPNEPVVFALAAVGMIAAGILASLLPSLRIVKIDPIRALRAE